MTRRHHSGSGAGSAERIGGASLLIVLVAFVVALSGPLGVLGRSASDHDIRSAPEPTSMPRPAASSVRPRGPEAPLPPKPTPTPSPDRAAGNASDDTGRGSRPATESGTSEQRQAAAPPVSDDARMWPLKVGAFTFTQAYGCVDQIGNFYNAAAGCPAVHPVYHSGIDLAAPLGTKIYAAASGWVTQAGLDRETGLANSQIIIQHVGANEGYATEYLHWQASYVRVGDFVRAGQPIAEVGSVGYSTGPHLHFSVIQFKTDERIDPMDWLPRERGTGGYLGLSPDAKRFPVANRGRAVPDYADPAPPPTPKRKDVPKRTPKERAPKAKSSDSSAADASSGGSTDASASGGKGDGKRHGKGRDGKRRDAVAAEPTPTPEPQLSRREERQQRRADANAEPTPTPESDAPKRERRHRDDAPAPTPTAVPEPTPQPWINAYVPPVPGVPAPPLPGVQPAAPTATPAPEPVKEKGNRDKGTKGDNADKTGDNSSGGKGDKADKGNDSGNSDGSGKHAKRNG